MSRVDTLLHEACEWAVATRRRLAVAIALMIVAPHLVEGWMLP